MEIANNIVELNKLLEPHADKIITVAGMRSDKSAEPIHPGVEAIVNRCKDLGDVMVMGYSALEPVLQLLYGENVLNKSYGVFDKSEAIEYWNLASVTPDILYFISFEAYISEYLRELNVSDVLAAMDQIWVNEGWGVRSYSTDLGPEWGDIETKISKVLQSYLWLNRKIDGHNRLYKNDIIVNCSKDGYTKYITAKFAREYCGYDYEVIDPVLTPEGVPYSSQIEYHVDPVDGPQHLIDLGKAGDMITKVAIENLKSEIERIEPTSFRVDKITANSIEGKIFVEVLVTIVGLSYKIIGEEEMRTTRGPFLLVGWKTN